MTDSAALLNIEVKADGVERAKRSLADLSAQGVQTEKSVANLGKQAVESGKNLSALGGIVKTAVASLAGFALVSMAKDVAILASRYNELGIVMNTVGRNAGYTATQLNLQEEALRKTGISMLESRSSITKLASAHIDLAKATDLARIAQDAAVIGGVNSSEAFARLVNGIQTAQVETLRTLGINVNFESSYAKLAATLGKTSNQLTELEKTQARVNAVMEMAPDIAGAYEASMSSAGKQIRSSTRYIEDFKVKVGDVFNEALTIGVMGFTSSIKDANGEIDKLAQDGQLKQWGNDVTDSFVAAADAVSYLVGKYHIAQIQIGKTAALSTNGLATFLGGGNSAAIKKDADAQIAAIEATFGAFKKSLDDRRKALAEQNLPKDPFIEKANEDALQTAALLRQIEKDRAESAVQEAKTSAEKAKTAETFRESTLKNIAIIEQENKLLAQGVPLQDAKAIATLKASGATDAMVVATLNANSANEKLIESLKQEQSFYDNFEKSLVIQADAIEAASDARLSAIQSAKDEVLVLRGVANSVEELAIARLEERKVILDGLGLNTDDLAREIKQRRELEGLVNSKKSLEDAKKDAESRAKIEIDAYKKVADEAKKRNEDINKSLTDALLRGFESGKSFAKNFKDNLVNMFKTLVLQPIVSFLVDASGITKALGVIGGAFGGGTAVAGEAASAVTGQSGFGGLLAQGKTLFDGITQGFGSLNNSFIEGIAGVGTTLRGFGFDNLGTLIENNSTMLGNIAPYAGAALSLLKGDVKGAAFQGVGAAIGSIWGPVGGAIGSFLGGAVGGLFGGKKQPPRTVTDLSGAADVFSNSLSTMLKGFGLQGDVFSNASYKGRKGGSGYGTLSTNINGIANTLYTKDKKGYSQAAIDAFVNRILSTELISAIKNSDLASGIKDLFNGMTDKTQVANMINASLALNSAQKQLADRFGLTVDQAGKVSLATGAVGDALIGFVNKLTQSAAAFNTVGEIMIGSKESLQTGLNKTYGTVVQDAVMKLQSRQVQVTPARQSSSAQGHWSMGGWVSDPGVSSFFGGLNKSIPAVFKTVTENVLTYVDRLIPASITLPESLKDYDALLKSINKTTLAGQTMFAEMFAMRDQFIAFTQAMDGLKGGVRGALFSIVSDAEKQSMLNQDLSKVFGGLGREVPASIQELIALGKTIDFTTKEGADLAAVFPSLVDAFVKTKGAVDSLMNSLRDVNQFKTMVDFNRYKGLASNYGNEFANRSTDGLFGTVQAMNSVNTPVNSNVVTPTNNTTVSTSDPNLLEAIMLLSAKLEALQATADRTAIQSKRAADVLVNVSPDGNILQTKATA